MLRPLLDLPAGVIGFDAIGEVHSDDYRDVLRPAIEAAAAAGPVHLVYVLGPEFSAIRQARPGLTPSSVSATSACSSAPPWSPTSDGWNTW